MPTPNDGETQSDFISRCIPIVIDDGTAETQEQAVAICNSLFENKTMNQLLSRIKSRNAVDPNSSEFGYGITTADRYVTRAVNECGGDLLKAAFRFGNAEDLCKEAATKLVYSNPDLITLKQSSAVDSMKKLLPEGVDLPKHAALVNVHTLTTPRIDRDKDVLHTSGAVVDPKMPSLWQHIHTLPVGKMLAFTKEDDRLRVVSVLLDLNELTSDMVKLIEADVLRFSHGFRALEFNERKAEEGEFGQPGFDVTKFEIMEESYVSVPSNVDGEMELFSSNKLSSDFFKAHAKHYMDQRPLVVAGMELKDTPPEKPSEELIEKPMKTEEETPEEEPTEEIAKCPKCEDVELKDGICPECGFGEEKEKEEDKEEEGGKSTTSETKEAEMSTDDTKHVLAVSEDEEGVTIRFDKAEEEPEGETSETTEEGKSIHDQTDYESLSLELSEELHQIKAGRTLSKANLQKLVDVRDHVTDLKDMEGMDRPKKAVCTICIKNLGDVISSADKPEEDEKPKSEESTLLEIEPEIVTVNPDAKEAAKILLAEGDDELLEKTLKSIKALLEISKLDAKGEEFRDLIS